MSSSSAIKEWHPARFTIGAGDDLKSQAPYIVIISNQPVENRRLLLKLCSKCKLREAWSECLNDSETECSFVYHLRGWWSESLERAESHGV